MSTEPSSQPSPDAPALVRIRGLHKYYDRHEVLKGIDLDVAPGEVIALIGRSGSGKSTLLRCINGLEAFQAGTLTVRGAALQHGNAEAMRQLRQQVGMVFQSFNLFPHLSVGRNVMLAPSLVQRRDLRAGEAQAREGMTLLMVTHEMGFARKVADRVVFMHAGRIHEMGPPEALFSAPQTPELQQFLSALH